MGVIDVRFAGKKIWIGIVESPNFASQADAIWSADERMEFFEFIATNPLAGEIVKGSGGVRKVRWSRQGTGKSGGSRVIYYFMDPSAPIHLLGLYSKSQKVNLSAAEIRELRAMAHWIKNNR